VAIELTYWLWGLAAIVGWSWLLAIRTRWSHVAIEVFAVWAVLSMATATWLTGASYLFIAPVLVTTSLALAVRLAMRWPNNHAFAVVVSMVGAVAAALIWLPIERLFYDAVGFRMNLVLAGRIAILLSTLLPLLVLTRRSALTKLASLVTFSAVVWTVVAVVAN
jgi:hypothetical protein